ncbi:hypothetical protein B484DRAFT_237258 [Ochromonadaceae sp. CCMP2298]|nr:hypothetical protein B484DRAFT_237258 [Ochromonadaceae sp. CCMP2298]
MREPTTLFDSLEIDTLPGLIQWVDRGDTYQIEEFASAPIMQRANLRKDRDYHASLAATEFDLTDNAPDPSSGLASGAKSPRVHFDTSRKHPHPAGERLDPHFDALHSHLGHMSAFIKQSHKRVLTRAHTRHRNPGYPLSEEEYEVMFASKEVLAMHSQDTPGDGDGDWAAQAAKAAAELMQPKSLILRNATQLETAGTRRELLGSRSRKPDPTRFDSAHIARVIAKHSAVIALQKQLAESIKTNSWEVTREFIDQMGGNVDLFKLNLFEEAVSIVKNRSTTYMAKVGDVQGDCWRLGNTATVLLNDIDQILEIHEKVAATLETFTDGIADLQELDEALLIMEELQKFLKPIIVPVSAIPMGVGALIKKFYDAYSLLVKTAVSPIQGATGKITAQFTESRMDRVEKIQELIDDWGEKLAELRVTQTHLFVAHTC